MSVHDVGVMLVEDDAADAELTVRSLRKGPGVKQIEIPRDGEEVLDFLLCRGTYAGRKIKEPPRVALTSSNHDRDLRECYELGVNSYIQKVVDLAEFEGAVRQLGSYSLGINHAPPTAAFGMSMPGSTP